MSASLALLGALRAKAGAPFRHVTTSVPWHSLDAIGERHEISLLFDDRVHAVALLDGLTHHEWSLSDHYVDEIVADSPERVAGRIRVRVEALTLPFD